MQRRSDIELFISAWSPEWLDGSGVSRVAEWHMSRQGNWQPSEIVDIDNQVLSTPLKRIRTSEHARTRPEPSRRPPDTTPIIHELKRLQKGRSGPLEERLVEYATSLIPCTLGLHAVDIRRPFPGGDEDLHKKHWNHPDSSVREILNEFRALCAEMPLAWAMCSIYGRAPSVAELYRREGPTILVGAVYVSKSVSAKEATEAFHPARTVDVGPGHEAILTKRFGGSMDEVPSPMYDALWKVLRKASITGLSWDVIRTLDAKPAG